MAKYKSAHEGTILKDRYTTEDVFERIVEFAGEEVDSKPRALFFSALAAGFAIILTFYFYATLTYKTGAHPILSALLYPIGFMYIVMGSYQLFTENTLPPVALVLERMVSIPKLFKVWGIVILGNVTGGLLGALVLAKTGLFSSGAREAATTIATNVMSIDFGDLFVKGAVAGFIVAGLVWLDYAARDNVTRLLQVYIAFLAIPLGSLNHFVVTATEVAFLAFNGLASMFSGFIYTVMPVLLGNIVGGVLLVTVVNYFQTPDYVQKDPTKRLKMKDWLFTLKTYKDM